MRVLKTLVAAGVAACAAVGSVAHATIVDTWSYIVTTQFIVGSECFVDSLLPGANQQGLGCPTPTPDPLFTSTTPSEVKFGIPAGPQFGGNGQQSSLVISNSPATGNVNTTKPPFSTPDFVEGEIGLTQVFTHNNNVVFSPTLDFVEVRTTLSLTPIVPAGGLPGQSPPVTPFPPASFDINVNFKETINQEPCDPPGATVCPDIFVAGQFNAFDFFYDFSPTDDEPAEHYFVQIFPFGGSVQLAQLSPAACAKAGVAPGCIGFVTEENQSNTVQFAFALTTQPFALVPEPGTLALFAVGLVGLGFAVRRKQA